MTLIKCPLREASLISGNAKALVTKEGSLTFLQLDQVVSGSVLALISVGVTPGARVALRLGNDWRAIALAMALVRIGAVVCPLNPKLPMAAQQAALRRAGCSWCVTDDGRGPMDDATRWLGVEDLVSMTGPDASRVPPIKLTSAQPATIFFTSGSSGEAKAVLHSLGNHYYSALGSNRNLSIRSGDAWQWSLPFHHVGGFQILYRCFLGGAAIVAPGAGDDEPVTHLSMVATQLRRLLHSLDEGREVVPPRHILLGGGPIPERLLIRALRRGINVLCTYGSTEMTSQVTTVHPDAPPEERLTAGRPLHYRELRIDADGEIRVRGPTRFLGYVDGESLEEPFDPDGWFATGDCGRLDEAGCLIVQGRKDNQFISGGENIQPEEIERALRQLSGVEDALVVPEPDDEYGMRPVAFVKVEGDVPGELSSALAQVLPSFMIPDRFLPWPEGGEGDGGLKPSREELKRMIGNQ